MIKIIDKWLLAFTLSLIVSACSSQTDINATAKPVTLPPDLQVIYQRSCQNCHEVEATGAPLTGDKAHWNRILEQGMALTLEHAMSGYQNMPAFGQCFECSPEQIETLITYMSNPAK